MGILVDYATQVKQEDYYYKHGRLTKKELDQRLQRIAKKYDREFFRFNRLGVKIK